MVHARGACYHGQTVVVVQHPLAALAPEAVLQRADAVVERIIEQLMTAH
jgi:hypothetical protein